MSQNIHIIKRGKKWAIVKEGASKAYKIYNSKPRAIYEATILLLYSGLPYIGMSSQLVVHLENGLVEDII